MDTPEVHYGTQPYGPEASAFAKREMDGERVSLELDVRKIDPYGMAPGLRLPARR